jgi:serine/threonine protein kinase
MTISPGSRLGPYEILAPLGAGGMGEVWRAKDTRLDREVAIKILPESFAQNEQFRARFEREAKTISSLNHPNICTLHDVGHEGGTHYLVMELIDGRSLADRLTKGPLPVHETLRYGAQIADALDRAHRQGIVHRDLKPGNVMLTKAGAKLLDFGLARAAAEASPVQGLTEMPTQAKPLTAEGTILGTFQYMAPEQLEGEEADARTDIFALGAVLYEMATGVVGCGRPSRVETRRQRALLRRSVRHDDGSKRRGARQRPRDRPAYAALPGRGLDLVPRDPSREGTVPRRRISREGGGAATGDGGGVGGRSEMTNEEMTNDKREAVESGGGRIARFFLSFVICHSSFRHNSSFRFSQVQQ